MSGTWETACVVDSRAADLFNRCRASALLGFLQEAAVGHAGAAGCGWRELYHGYGAHWVLVRQQYWLRRPLTLGERLSVRTWLRAPGRAACHRDFELFAEGEPVGEAAALWAVIDARSRRFVRLDALPPVAAFLSSARGEREGGREIEYALPDLPLEAAAARTVYYSDCDHNRHMNNARYADFACDALRCERREGWIDSMLLHYRAECRAGETLRLSVGENGDAAWVKGETEAGAACFAARLHFTPAGIDNCGGMF